MIENVYQVLMDNFVLHLGIIASLVAFLKELFKLEGNAVRICSFLVGLFVAGIYYIGFLIPEIAGYIEGGFFILVSGLIASGFYDLAQNVRNGS